MKKSFPEELPTYAKVFGGEKILLPTVRKKSNFLFDLPEYMWGSPT